MLLWLSITAVSLKTLSSHYKIPAVEAAPTLGKIPRTSLSIRERKEPVSIQVNWLEFKPSWRIIALEMADPFGWHKVDMQTLAYIRDKLRYFETMTLGQIFINAKKRNHGVELYKLCGDAQKRLRQLGYDDLDELYTLRLSALERVWGIRECNVFSLLWWDPKHQVCPSLK